MNTAPSLQEALVAMTKAVEADGDPAFAHLIRDARAALAMQASAPAPLEVANAESERAKFYEVWEESTKLTGHKPSHFDVWLMARGLMDTNHRATSTKPAPTGMPASTQSAAQVLARNLAVIVEKCRVGYTMSKTIRRELVTASAIADAVAAGLAEPAPTAATPQVELSDDLEAVRSFWQRHTQSNTDRMSLDDMHAQADAATPQRDLTEDEWLDLAEAHANADWNSDKPDGYLNSIKAVCAGFLAARGKP